MTIYVDLVCLNRSSVQLSNSDSMKFKSRQVFVDLRFLRRDEMLHRPNIHVSMWLDETCNRLSLWQDAVGHILEIDGCSNLVQTSFEKTVGQVLETVADIHQHLRGMFVRERDERIGFRAVTVLNLQTTSIILEEERNHSEIGVWPGTTVFAGVELLRGDRSVVVNAKFVDNRRSAAVTNEFALGKSKALLQVFHDLTTYDMAQFQVLLHELAVAWDTGFRWPFARELGVGSRAMVEVFLRSVSALFLGNKWEANLFIF